jgi:uncharacterized membrane protein (UPF0127 family)
VELKIRKGDIVVCQKAREAKTMISAMIGLMFSKDLGKNDGLMIYGSRSIHTFFMRYNLDIIFLNSENKIVKIIRQMRPWRMTWIYFRARNVLEMTGGTLPLDISEGDILEVSHV